MPGIIGAGAQYTGSYWHAGGGVGIKAFIVIGLALLIIWYIDWIKK